MDTKVLTSWNGLMIAPLADGAAILDDDRYVEAARRAAAFVLDRMRAEDGRLLHSYKDGQAKFNGYLDDYANLIDGLTHLYEATGEPRWIEAALELAGVMIEEFHDRDGGGFFYTGTSHEELIARQKDAYDNATPSGNAMAATALLRLGALTGRDDLTELGARDARDRAGRAREGADGGRTEPDRPGFPPGDAAGVRRRRRGPTPPSSAPSCRPSTRDSCPTRSWPRHPRGRRRPRPSSSPCWPTARRREGAPRPISASGSPARRRRRRRGVELCAGGRDGA